MKLQKFFCISVLLWLGMASASEQFVLENEFMRVSFGPQGGKIVSWFDKMSGRELLDQTRDRYQGAVKSREILFNSIEPFTRKFGLAKTETGQVRASAGFKGGVLKGMTLERIYELLPGRTELKIEELWRSGPEANHLLLNWHSEFIRRKDTSFILSDNRGMVTLTPEQASRHQYSVIRKPENPVFSAYDRSGGTGISLIMKNAAQIQEMYSWHDFSKFTLEANFRECRLEPAAAADELKISGSFILWRARGEILCITEDAVLSRDKGRIFICFVSSPGRCTVNGKELKAQAGKLYEVPAAGAYRIETADREFVLRPAMKLDSGKAVRELLPVVREAGVEGYYYFFPKMYLSEEFTTPVRFGLRGDFSRKKNFHLRLRLPPGVEITSGYVQKIGEKKDHIHEIWDFRNKTYFNVVPLDLRLGKNFNPVGDCTAFIQAVWDGGRQEPYQFSIGKIPLLPALQQLKYFDVMGDMMKTVTELSDRQIAEMNVERCGFNVIRAEEWPGNFLHEKHFGEGYFRPFLDKLQKHHLGGTFDLGAAYYFSHNCSQGLKWYLKGAGTLFHDEKRYVELDPSDFLAVNHRGKMENMPCPAYRGRYFEKNIDCLKTLIDYGFNHIFFDEETWSRGASICYCPRCRPHAGTPEEHWQWKTDQVADIYRRFRETIDTYRPKAGVQRRLSVWVDASVAPSGRYGAIHNRLTDYKKIGRYADDIIPMVYTADPVEVGRQAGISSALLKGARAKLIMGLSPNRTYEYHRVQSGNLAGPEAEIHQILEACFNGARGVCFWNCRNAFRGALGYYNVARAVALLNPVEEIIARGKPVNIRSSNPEVLVSAYRYQDRIVLFARNYEDEIVKTWLELPFGRKQIVLDKIRYQVLTCRAAELTGK